MKVLITGGCGFVGTNLALFLKKKKFNVSTLDSLFRVGSSYNLAILKKNNIKNFKIDIKNYKKILKLPKFDLIIDCCAEASVEISKKSVDRVIDTNLIGTINILKKCKKDNSKIIFISSSRIYPINRKKNDNKIVAPIKIRKLYDENTSVNGPKTIYGLTKLSSEMFIEEFSYAFNIKYLINRCGVISGPLQFGKQDQGFVSLWIWRHLVKKKLKYIGFGGNGYQVRDVLHIQDLCELIECQIKKMSETYNQIFTVGGSTKSYISLKNLTLICEKITGNKLKIGKEKKTSIYDAPYFIMSNKKVSKMYKWKPKRNIHNIVNETFIWLSKNKKSLSKYFN